MNCKPKLTPEEILVKLENEKGISFNLTSKKDAVEFLKEKNNYYRLASYRKNYEKKQTGINKGQYNNLDFSYLIDLSTIDMHLRFLILKMCLDIEHDLKVSLINDIANNHNEDGYSIVKDFLQLDSSIFLLREIYKKRNSTYVGNIIYKYFEFTISTSEDEKEIQDHVVIDCPIWAFVEIISFGSFLKLYQYYYKQNGEDNQPIANCLLNAVKDLRNACAHNNCIINNLHRTTLTKPGRVVSQFVAKIPGTTKDTRNRYLSVRPIFDFISLLIVYDMIVSTDVKTHRYEELKDLVYNRMTRNKHYYDDQQVLRGTYNFIKKIVDFIC